MVISFYELCVGAAMVVAALVYVGIFAIRDRSQQRPLHIVASMIEEQRPSTVGALCIALLLIWNIGAAYGFARAAKISIVATAMTSTPYLLIWVAGNQVLSLGVLLGRKRRYVILQEDDAHRRHSWC